MDRQRFSTFGIYVTLFVSSMAFAIEDPIRTKLDQAVATFESETEKYQAAVDMYFERREETARKKGDKQLVDQIKRERQVFDEKGKEPELLPRSIASRLTRAQADLDAAFRTAIQEYTKAKEDAKASAIEKELEQFSRGRRRPADAVKFGRNYYKVYSESVSWHEAERKCKELGGQLVVIDSAEENLLVFRIANDAKLTAVWLGYSDHVTEGVWRTVDNASAKFINWGRGQPNNLDDEDYAVMYMSNNGAWWDFPGNPKEHPNRPGILYPGYVCEWE